MKKNKKIFVKILIAMGLIEIIHFIVYISISYGRIETYFYEFIEKSFSLMVANQNSFSLTATNHGYYLDIIPYDDLSIIYKRVITEEEFASADNDKKRMEIYNKVIRATLFKKSTANYTTIGYKKGGYYEYLVVDGIRYKVEHEVDIKTNYFTFKPYISKWMITIERIYE